jgi:signal transduction histidine kinase
MTNITNEDFALEVKGDRLKTLYQFTLIFCATAGVLVFTFGFTLTQAEGSIGAFLLAIGALAVGCFVTRTLLEREMVVSSAWAYSLGTIASTSILLMDTNSEYGQIVIFVLPVIVFLAGLLLSPTHTFFMATISAGVALVAPNFFDLSTFVVEGYQIFAVFLMYLATIFAVQVSGELYQITEWALANYQRQRRTNTELFDNRQALQLSLKRSEILGERLTNSNQELESAYSEAEEAKEFRGQFLANMSHELRTPLNAIIGFSETMLKFPMMYDNQPLPDMYERDLSQIFNSGRQLLHVINDILDLAKVDAGKLETRMQEVDPSSVISAVVSTAKGLVKGQPIMFVENLPDPLPTVWADETRLRQVLLNLYSNACKYTDEGEIALNVYAKDGKMIFDVKDTGLGIAPEFHEAVFEEFRQASDAGRAARAGTGLGLPISKQLLELMNGEIWVESEVGVGSTFSFSLELYTGQENEDRAASTEPEVDISVTDTTPMPRSTVMDGINNNSKQEVSAEV